MPDDSPPLGHRHVFTSVDKPSTAQLEIDPIIPDTTLWEILGDYALPSLPDLLEEDSESYHHVVGKHFPAPAASQDLTIEIHEPDELKRPPTPPVSGDLSFTIELESTELKDAPEDSEADHILRGSSLEAATLDPETGAKRRA